MSTRINHNILSLTAQRNLYVTQNQLNTAVTRLSSGLRINNAWEDPAGLAISERFRAQIASMEEAERNANYNINMIQTAEGALSIIGEILVRMRSLAVQASNGALDVSDRGALDAEFQALKEEITRIADSTSYNGKFLLSGDHEEAGAEGTIRAQIGIERTDYIEFEFAGMTASALSLTSAELTGTNAQLAISSIDSAIDSKNTARTSLGAYVERLQHTIRNMQVTRENAVKSESQIRDADIAQEMSAFTRAQILTQSGIAMLAQANSVPQMIAGLIGG